MVAVGTPVPPFHPTIGTPQDYEPFLSTDAQVDIRYERNRDKSVTVNLVHSGIPVEGSMTSMLGGPSNLPSFGAAEKGRTDR